MIESYSSKLKRIKESFDSLNVFDKQSALSVVTDILLCPRESDEESFISELSLRMVMETFKVSQSQLTSKKRTAHLSTARNTYMLMLYSLTGMPTYEIGRVVGHTNHTAVNYARKSLLTVLELNYAPYSEAILNTYEEVRGKNAMTPPWFNPTDIKNELMAITDFGRFDTRSEPKWMRYYTKYGRRHDS